MKISEILELEKSNKNEIILIKEGYFWRAYERSALRFIQFIQEFQVVKKNIKYLDKEIVFLWFPVNILDKIKEKIKELDLKIYKKQDDILQIKPCLETEDFNFWKQSLPLMKISSKKDKEEVSKNSEEESIIAKIRNFSTINKTPLEAMQFIVQLQEEFF